MMSSNENVARPKSASTLSSQMHRLSLGDKPTALQQQQLLQQQQQQRNNRRVSLPSYPVSREGNRVVQQQQECHKPTGPHSSQAVLKTTQIPQLTASNTMQKPIQPQPRQAGMDLLGDLNSGSQSSDSGVLLPQPLSASPPSVKPSTVTTTASPTASATDIPTATSDSDYDKYAALADLDSTVKDHGNCPATVVNWTGSESSEESSDESNSPETLTGRSYAPVESVNWGGEDGGTTGGIDWDGSGVKGPSSSTRTTTTAGGSSASVHPFKMASTPAMTIAGHIPAHATTYAYGTPPTVAYGTPPTVAYGTPPTTHPAGFGYPQYPAHHGGVAMVTSGGYATYCEAQAGSPAAYMHAGFPQQGFQGFPQVQQGYLVHPGVAAAAGGVGWGQMSGVVQQTVPTGHFVAGVSQ